MSCERYAEAIADHACGAGLAPDAARHLRSCAACAATLEAERRAVGALDRELQDALAIEPSAHFVQRVQARLRQAPAPAPTPRLWWALAAAAAIIATGVTGSFVLTSGSRGAPPPAVGATASPAASIARAPVVAPAPPSVPGQARPRPSRHAREGSKTRRAPDTESPTRTLEASAVILPPGQLRAIDRYLALVRGGQLDTSPLAAQPDASAADLVVTPLSIDPLAMISLDSGSNGAAERRPHE